ncbi:hypothetical protein GGR54DRAFT_632302 [Hypoxylon sp. NC1633]|nr:hypothetical protein GGR54DRAFT_632302 [Hypoxylon sp. NC1633]
MLTALATARSPGVNGVGLIYAGDCGTVNSLDLWLHLLINLLSTFMLAASNYCMQLLAAPTRADINRAHQDHSWLDIGILSFRNLRFVSRWKQLICALLVFTSLPIHLMYNSAVFQSHISYDYTVAVVKDSFLDNSTWSLETAVRNRGRQPGWSDPHVNPPNLDYLQVIHGIQQSAINTPYVRRNISQCFELYNDYFAPQGNVVVLVKNESIQMPADDSLLMYVSVVPRSDDWGKNMWALGNGTGEYKALPPTGPITDWYLGPPKYEVSRCLVQPLNTIPTPCRFEYSQWIMIIVCSLNLIKVMVILGVLILRRYQDSKRSATQKEVLYTLGDAVASFMRVPDTTTENMCLATRDDFLAKRSWSNHFVKKFPSPSTEPREWNSHPKLWFNAASWKRWFVLLFGCFVVIAIAASLLSLSSASLRHRNIPFTFSSLWSIGFGRLNAYTYIVIGLTRPDPAGLFSNVLIANLPQVAVSVLYIFYNAMLSTFLVQREFSKFPTSRKTLRVYFISMPLGFGIPLYITSGIMHWLISQSFFLARITAIHPDEADDTRNSFSTCAYSPLAIFITLLVGLILVLGLVGLSFRKYDGTMRMVSTNSRAISAACHCPPQDRESGYLLPLTYGVVEMNDGVGRMAFTTASDVRLPEAGGKYR